MRQLRTLAAVCGALAVGAAFAAAAPQSPSPAAWPEKVDPWVLSATAGGPAEFLVMLSEQADLSGAELLVTKEHKGRFVYDRLRETADRTQGPLLALLKARGAEHRPFWVANMVWVKGDAALVEELAARADVARVNANPRVRMEEPLPGDHDPRAPQAVEPGVTRVRAPEVWAAGFTGQTVVVGGQDTGYDWDHPALINKYRGWNGASANHNYNWHDAIHSGGGVCGADSTQPCDDDSHGTHTMGTMVGDDGAGNQVGVAPGARWIGCRNMDQGNGTPATYSECFQWFIAPTDLANQNPDPTKAPHVINNSWGCPPSEGCVDPNALLTVVNNTRAAGIVVVVSAGNSGSGCSSVNTPAAIYDSSFSVGATNNTDVIASFSSRGPVTVDASNRLKPNISAPGVNVRSSVPGGGYSSAFSGTSMAGPHVAGAVALLMAAHPTLKGQVDQVETTLEGTAVARTTTQTCGGVPGSSIPNNTYGFGRVDSFAAVASRSANLGLSAPAWPARVLSGQPLSFTLTAANAGPLAATGVTLSEPLPSGFVLGSATPSQGTCSGTTTITCALGSIGMGASATVDVVTTPSSTGTRTSRATLAGAQLDMVAANNIVDFTTVVEACPPAAPAITAPLSAAPGTTGLTASVTSQAAHTYTWTLTGGTITGGQGTAQVTFTAGSAGTTMALSVVDTVLGCESSPARRNVQVHFLDVPPAHLFHQQVNTLARNQVTAGCGAGNYCPEASVTRAQMAVFLLVSKEGANYAPPACVTPMFNDVPCSHPFAAWVNELAVRGIASGCGSGNYCPASAVTRQEMAVLLLSTEEPPGYTPPACVSPAFADVPCSNPFAAWINELAARGVTSGCGSGNYCPAAANTRGQMAVFLVATFGLN